MALSLRVIDYYTQDTIQMTIAYYLIIIEAMFAQRNWFIILAFHSSDDHGNIS